MVKMIEKKINNYCLFIFKDKNELSKNITDFIENHISNILKAKERFQFCVCGGSTPRSVYELLSFRKLFWEKVDIFLGDERFAQPDSEKSNTLMLRNSLLKNQASKAFFYQIFEDNNLNEEISKDKLINQLGNKCRGNPPVFDLTLLGLGDDGHTASLFPYKQNNPDNELVLFNYGNGLKRLSMTPKLLSASSKVIFLVSGSSKGLALKRLVDNNEKSDRTPAKLVKSNSEILVFCDQEASKDLSI